MTSASTRPAVHLPVLALELPDGWSVSEAAGLHSPSGRTFDAYVGPVPLGSELDDLVDLEVELATTVLGAVDVGNLTRTRLRGGPAAGSRDLRFVLDGTDHVLRIACGVIGEHLLRFVGRWPLHDDIAPAEFDTVVAGAFVRSRAIAIKPDGDRHDTTDAAPGVGPASDAPPHQRIEPSAWRQVRSSWSSGPSTGEPASLSDLASWSPQELLVAAAASTGVDTFPTVDGEALTASPQAVVDAVTEAVLASLIARGLVEVRPASGPTPAGALARIADVALAPDLVLWIEPTTDDLAVGWWIGVRTDAALQLTVHTGERQSAWLDPAAVVDHALHLVTKSSGLTTVTAVWREGDLIRGGAFAWNLDDTGATWLGDGQMGGGGEPLNWDFAPADPATLRAHLLGYLPGGAG